MSVVGGCNTISVSLSPGTRGRFFSRKPSASKIWRLNVHQSRIGEQRERNGLRYWAIPHFILKSASVDRDIPIFTFPEFVLQNSAKNVE
jgi:hypothetical protein